MAGKSRGLQLHEHLSASLLFSSWMVSSRIQQLLVLCCWHVGNRMLAKS